MCRIIQCILCLLMACTAPNKPAPEDSVELAEKTVDLNTINPTKKLTAGFLAIDGVYQSELFAPYDILQHSIFHTKLGIETFVVSPTLSPIKTFEGIEVKPHYSFENCPEIDILVVPSAVNNMDTDLENDTLINFVKERGEAAQFIMSLCDGAFILAKAGLLDGIKCTTFPSDIPKFRKTFPKLAVQEDISFVHDGKAITSAGGAKSYDPALYLTELLYGKKVAGGVAGGLVIDWKLEEIERIIE